MHDAPTVTGKGGPDDGRGWEIRLGDGEYPLGILDLENHSPGQPERLYGLGNREVVARLDTGDAVTIVGSRRATQYGREVAERLGFDLAAAGLVVISGMAHGIDAAAHRGALDAGGTTIAVLGGGPDVIYPPGQRHLHRRIIASGGAVIAELTPGTTPAKWSFPARNRLMAAMATVTVVVEATERSGTRITSDWALDLQRQIGAVPGPVTSRMSDGPNSLIRDGATPILKSSDVLDMIGGVGCEAIARTGPPIESQAREVLAAVEGGADRADQVAAACGMPAMDVAIALTRLELYGYLRTGGRPDRYLRTTLAAPEASEAPGAPDGPDGEDEE